MATQAMAHPDAEAAMAREERLFAGGANVGTPGGLLLDEGGEMQDGIHARRGERRRERGAIAQVRLDAGASATVGSGDGQGDRRRRSVVGRPGG